MTSADKDSVLVDNEILQKPRVITPFPSPKLMDLLMFQGEHKEDLYWGTYRPQAYFGVRARTPESLIVGLMWLVPKDGEYVLRHLCNFDDIKSFGWKEHNGRDFGLQELVEQEMFLETSFVKSKEGSLGYGGDWSIRINVENIIGMDDEVKRGAHLFLYIADEAGTVLNVGEDVLQLKESSTLASGFRTDVGNWQMHLKSQDPLETHYCGFKTHDTANLSDLVQQNLSETESGGIQLSDTSEHSSSAYVFQFSTMSRATIDIAFVSGMREETTDMEERVLSLTGLPLSDLLEEKHIAFDAKFKKCFDNSEKMDSETLVVGKATIANMLGGIGYFFGQSQIQVPDDSEEPYLLYWPAELYTAVPSRPKFSWGFLWDEGFHQLLIWFALGSPYITLEIVGHWLDLMNIDGWIPREQILGEDALRKIKKGYTIQDPSVANPPTLLLVIRELIDGIKTEKFNRDEIKDISSFLDRAFERLEKWFQWYNTSQIGKEDGSYYWHGRDDKTDRELNPLTLSSGLDDYPRASHPNGDERHVDLRCWMYFAADSMNSIQEFLRKDDGEDYSSIAKKLSDFPLLNKMHYDHYDHEHGTYLDYGNHTEDVRLILKVGHHEFPHFVRDTYGKPVPRFVPHIGYVCFFPLMFKLIPSDSTILEEQLNLISNSSIMWSDYGLLSLAKTSSLYMKRNAEDQAPYWRGAIWMNMNYFILSALNHYSSVDGPYRCQAETIYKELRSNLIRNVVTNYDQTGYIWEHYDQTNGTGEGGRMFTGWSALILLIMSEEYPLL